jgi:hypothetical protein
MESTKKVYIDKKAEQNFRKYKEGDHIIFLYGIRDNILGLWDSHPLELDKFELTLPTNMKINGMILIYNDNVYEDFDSLIQTELENLKSLKQISHLIADKIYAFLMKDVLYLDDFDAIQYEKNVLFDLNEENPNEEEVNPITYDLDTKLKSEYFYLKSLINVSLVSEKGANGSLAIDSKEDVEKYFSVFKNFFIFLKHPYDLMIDNFENLNKINVDHIIKILTKLNISKKENESNVLQFLIGVKTSEGETLNIEKIEILSKSINENLLNKSFSFEIGGYLPKNFSSENSDAFKNIINSFKNNLQYVLNQLKNEQEFVERISFENHLFTTHPVFSEFSSKTSQLQNRYTLDKKLHLYTTKFINKNTLKPSEYQVSRLVNVHTHINKEIGKYSKRFLVKGKYEYFHYGQDGFNDKNWGCAYRSLQTLYSWFLMNGFSTKKEDKVPSILDIQNTLVKAGDKESKIIGSNDWIGAFEVSIVLNELLGVESQILYVSSGADLNSKGREIAHHFENNGSPIMIGGGVYAYTILGIEYDRVIGECLFLILDPHYYGEDDVKTIINKGWCEWKTAALFQKENFYNMCMPQVPKC